MSAGTDHSRYSPAYPASVASAGVVALRVFCATSALTRLATLGPGAGAVAAMEPGPNDTKISQISFVTPRQGWVLTVYSKLMSTNDGGATWTDITPGRVAAAVTP